MAGQRCSICSHAQRAAAEEMLAFGHSVRKVAQQLSLPYQSLDRHQRNCVRDALTQAALARRQAISETVEAHAVAHGGAMRERVEELQTLTMEIFTIVKAASDFKEARLCIGTMRKNLELLARLTGELDPAETERRGPTFEEFEVLWKARRVRL